MDASARPPGAAEQLARLPVEDARMGALRFARAGSLPREAGPEAGGGLAASSIRRSAGVRLFFSSVDRCPLLLRSPGPGSRTHAGTRPIRSLEGWPTALDSATWAGARSCSRRPEVEGQRAGRFAVAGKISRLTRFPTDPSRYPKIPGTSAPFTSETPPESAAVADFPSEIRNRVETVRGDPRASRITNGRSRNEPSRIEFLDRVISGRQRPTTLLPNRLAVAIPRGRTSRGWQPDSPPWCCS